jgi:hypothetical protein
MAALAVDDIYERHIRSLPAEQRLRLLARIAAELAAEGAATTGPRLHNVMEFYGVGRRSWDGSDAQEFVNKLRAEWDERRW